MTVPAFWAWRGDMAELEVPSSAERDSESPALRSCKSRWTTPPRKSSSRSTSGKSKRRNCSGSRKSTTDVLAVAVC